MTTKIFRPAWLAFAAGAALWLSPGARADITFTTIHDFTPNTDGNVPFAELVEGTDGKFYGTTTTGGKQDRGTIFSLERNGDGFKVLSAFSSTNSGNMPESSLIQARDGNFYGTTYAGGANGDGSLFQLTPAGGLTVLTSFTSGDPGTSPGGALLEGIDGFLYGTAGLGGVDDFGTVFRATVPAGAAATFSTFEGGLDGSDPQSDLIQARDGNFYGTTSTGGTDSAGTFFQLTPSGVRTILYNFTNGTDGSLPLRGVIQGADGAFYGITQNGGTGAGGVIYRLTVSGTTATLVPLVSLGLASGDAYTSYCRLLQASDGNFYGTTYQGGTSGAGTIFQMTPGGVFTVLYSFTNGADGGYPDSGLIQGDDGKLYGTTAGVNGSDSTVFKVDLGLALPAPVVRLFAPASAAAGDTVQLAGNYFGGTTGVTFQAAGGGTVAAASFHVASLTSLSAVVPASAVTGVVTVTVNSLTGTTPYELTVTSNGSTPPVITPGSTTVTITAPDAVASFEGNNEAHFRISRYTDDVSQAETVIFKETSKSSAVAGSDYTLVVQGQTLASVTNSITIPAGKSSIRVKVVPIATSATSRPDVSLTLKLLPGADYTVGAPKKATVTIAGYSN